MFQGFCCIQIAGKEDNTKYSQNENQVPYQYEKSNNLKVDNMKQSASQYFDNAEDTHELIDTYEKIMSDKNYNILFDHTITNTKGESVNAKITTLENGEVEIRINPNSKRAGEFLIMHEVSHAIKTQEMIDFVNKFASKNPTFKETVKSLEQLYGKDLASEEVFADVCGQLFGNQEFINSLVMENTPQSRTTIQKIYDSIKRILNNFTKEGRYRNFVQDLEAKWREAYRQTTTEQAVSNLDGETKHSTQENEGTDSSSFSLEKRLTGDELLNAQDMIDELKSVGANIDNNGYVTVYHQTTAENANKIIETGKMFGREYGIFFSTSKDAQQSEGRGSVKLEFKIPVEKLTLDDIFDDNADVKIYTKPNQEIDISEYMVANNQNLKYNTNIDLSTVKEGELKNDFYKALTTSQWKTYHTKMNKVMDSTYRNLNRTDIIGGKIVCTEIKNHKEQVVNVLKVSKTYNEKVNHLIKEANEYGYSGQQLQEIIENSIGKENVSRYTNSIDKFKRVSELENDIGRIVKESKRDDRKTTQRSDKRYNNREFKELDNSSFSLEKLPKVKNGYTRLYRGLNEKYDANYDRSKLDSPNGYDTLTDNYDLAKQYATMYIILIFQLIKYQIVL